jgi:hypothetical protein
VVGVLFVFQTASAGACTAPAPCRLLAAAAAANQTAMLSAGGYRATIETETATLGRREGRIEGPTLLEQASSQVVLSNEGGFTQHVVGSRSFPNAIPLSRLALLRIGSVMPTLAGERLQVIARSGPGDTKYSETLRGPLTPGVLVHPLASDRDDYYRFEGAETPVWRTIDGVKRKVFAIEVIPRSDLTREDLVFEGEMDLDPASCGLARLYGRLRVVGPTRRGGFFNFEPKMTLVELVDQRLPNGSWVPLVQRFEIQSSFSLTSGFGTARRVISRFHDTTVLEDDGSGPGAIAAVTSGYVLTSASRDSLRGFRGWHLPAGRATEAVSEADFSRYRPGRLQSTGRPVLLLQGPNQGDFLRFNRIEGVFTGLSVIARLRDAAPGLSLQASAGYAWSEKMVRGFGGAGWDSGPWRLSAGGGRTLEVTNKFRDQFDNPSLGALAGRDPWDYVERQGGLAAIARSLSSEGAIAQLELARVTDRTVTRHMNKAPSGALLRLNRNITPGTYWRGRALLDWHPAVSPLFAHDGVGFRAEVESATGDLDYTRVEGRVVLRKSFSRIFVIARLHAGAVFATDPPPQQLFELGGPAGLPGYDYKEFAGVRAALFRVRVSYPLSLLDLPFRIGSGVTLPSLSPAISVGFQGGFTNAHTAGGLAAVRALGDKHDDKTGALITDPLTGQPLPAAVATDKLKSSVDIRIGFFGDALAVGFARSLEKGRKTQFIFAFGRQF